MGMGNELADYDPVRNPRRKVWVEESADRGWHTPVANQDYDLNTLPATTSSPPAVPKIEKREGWLKRGHTLSYAGLFLFTLVLYFRPYELVSSLSSLTSLAFWIAVVTLVVFFPTQLGMEGNLTFRPREINLVLLLCVTALISIPLAISPGEAWETFYGEAFLKAVLMFIVLVNVVRTERRLRGLFFLALAVSVWLSWGALADYQAGNFTVEAYRVAGSLSGMFGNPNDMALHLVTIIPIGVALFLTGRSILTKILYCGCVVLMVAAVVVTYSRGGFLGLLAVSGMLAWKLGRRNRVLVSAVTVISLCLFIALAPGNYGERISSIFNDALDPVGSGSARSELLKKSVITSIANPVFGVGMGNFHIVAAREAESHNAYTQVSSEMGLAAALIYTMFVVAPLRRLRRIEGECLAAKDRSGYYFLAVGLQVSIIGYMVGSFFASVAYHFYIYYLVGYAISLHRLYAAQGGSAQDPVKTRAVAPSSPTQRTGA
jgi:putative inorganic carbon (hco3(-)) transporter